MLQRLKLPHVTTILPTLATSLYCVLFMIALECMIETHQWVLSSRFIIYTDCHLFLESQLNELPLILDMMPAEDMKLLCKDFKVSYQSSKQRAVEALMKHSNSFKPIFGSKPTSSILLTKCVPTVCCYAYLKFFVL